MIFEWIMSGKVVNLPVIVINFAAHLKKMPLMFHFLSVVLLLNVLFQ